MNLAIDIDDVIFPFKTQFRDFAESHLEAIADEDLPPIDQWNFHDKWGITLKELYDLFNVFIEDRGYERGTPISGARTYLRELNKKHKVYLITTRGSKRMPTQLRHTLISSTASWLSWYKIPYDGLIFTDNKGMFQADILLDDHMENLKAASKAGIKVIAFDQPWNQGWKGARIKTWKEFHERIT